jgi:hypothetical protein
MAKTYTLEEAAQRLGLTPEIFKKRLREDWKNSLKSFRDGSTLRFRSVDIDELARSLGQASDPGLQLGDAAQPLSDSSEELILESSAPKSKPKPGSSKKLKSNEQALYLSDDSDDIFALPATDSGISKKKPKGDSDVRLDLTPTKKDPKAKELTEEITLDLDPPSGKNPGKSSARLLNPASSRLTPPAPGSAKIPGAQASGSDDGSSEFELSLDSDSDSFELQLNNDSSEEVALGGEATKTGGGASGINLGKPSDSGVSLERKGKKKPAEDDSDSLDFDLTLDSSGGPKSRPIPSAKIEDGSSEFELTLEDSDGSASMNALAAQEQANRDIFETDFQLPTDDDSGSEVLPVDSSDTDLENSDFDLAISDADAPSDEDSASEVVMMDDDAELLDSDEGDSVLTADIEDEDKPTPSTQRRRGLKSDGDDEEDMSTAMGKRSRATDDAPVRSLPPAPPKWGILPLLMLVPTFIIAFLGLLLTLEIVRGMAGYQAPNATSSPLANSVAELFGGKAKK